MKPNLKFRISEPPLETAERVEVDDTGKKIRITTLRRGILGTKSKTYESILTWANERSGFSPKENVEKLCEALRDQLELWGLPSDRQPSWIKIGDGEWQLGSFDDAINSEVRPIAGATWYSRLNALTEPLSKQRCTGELLFALTDLLAQPGIEPLLFKICLCMDAYSTLRIAGATNFFAAAGMAAQKGRAIGPATKRKQAEQRKEIISSIANKFWSTSPIHRFDATNTAAAIVEEVNEALALAKLLPSTKKGLSVKTISDGIRASVRGKII